MSVKKGPAIHWSILFYARSRIKLFSASSFKITTLNLSVDPLTDLLQICKGTHGCNGRGSRRGQRSAAGGQRLEAEVHYPGR